MIQPEWLEALAVATDRSPKQLEKQFGVDASRWALLQVELRKKAKAKFTEAQNMLFDREALEQATHEAVAAYHASCFPEGATVVDMTCGIGSDLRAFGTTAIGFDLDPDRVFCASFNCPSATIRCEDGLAYVTNNDVPYIWADPDRRDQSGRRLADPSAYSPDPLAIPRDRELTGIKLSPLLDDEYLELVGPRVEFVSYRGECREAVVWSGRKTEPGFFAVQIDSGSVLPRNEIYDVVSEPEEFIYDADPAATRAHALGNFDMPQLGDSPGYLTGGPVNSEWLSGYQVLASGSYDVKRIRESLRNLKARVFEVKQRGAGLDPGDVMRQIKTEGTLEVSLIAWRMEKSVRYALAKRA